MASINHVGLYVSDLEASREFFETYFGAVSSEMYHNPVKLFSSYMLTFGDGARLEIMTKPDLSQPSERINHYGYAHFSVSVGSHDAVNSITEKLVEDGYRLIDGPRTTGDGYYESAVLDAEGNVVEITV